MGRHVQKRSCKICDSPDRGSIDMMFLEGLSFKEMIDLWGKMLEAGHVEGDPLTLSLLSKHKAHVIAWLTEDDRKLMAEIGTELREFQGGLSFLNPAHESKFTFKKGEEPDLLG
jgi:hypothetical protein